MRKEKSDQNAVAELTREGLYKENKWLWEENKKLKEYNGELIENHKKDIAILCEENKKLKSDLHFERNMLDNVRAEYDSLQNVIKKLEEENENLKAIIEHYKKFEEGKEKLEGMLMEEDTLQELRDLGKI